MGKEIIKAEPIPTVEVLETPETPKLQGKENQPTYEELLTQLEELKAQAESSSENTENNDKTVEEWLNERVPFIAFKDNDKYKDDLHIGINGHNTIIKRGVQVMIPRHVYMAIQDSEKQTLEADVNAEKKATTFDNESRTRGFDN